MSYCPYCGRELSNDMVYCPGCGAAVSAEERSYVLIDDNATAVSTGSYAIYITGLGSANKSEVIDLLEDALGYTTTTAKNLVNSIPVEIAANLTLKQAAVVAQAFEEYGVELSVTNGDEYEDISKNTSTASLFNSDGSFLTSAALVLATIGAAHRLRTIVRPKKPSLLKMLFHSLLGTKRRPPVHVRRTITPRPRNVVRPLYPQQKKITVRQKVNPFGYNSAPSGGVRYNNNQGGPKKNTGFGNNGPKAGPGSSHNKNTKKTGPGGFGSHRKGK